MKNNSIEDIYIGDTENKGKKGKKGIIIVIVVLIFILIAIIGAYFYFSSKTVTEKQAFVNGLSNTNIKKFSDNNIYEEISKRILEENSESKTNIKFSATELPEQLKDIDISNFEFNLVNNNDIDTSKSYAELGLNYSGNEIFKVKLLASNNEVGLASDEIVTRYVGVHYDKINEVFGIDFNKEDLNKMTQNDKINLTQEEKEIYKQKYLTKVFEQIPDEKFSKQENIAITKNNASVNVVSYNLTLSQDEYKNILTNILTELKNDNELLNKLVTGEETQDLEESNSENVEGNVPVINSDENSEETNTAEAVQTPDVESTPTINIHEETNSSEEHLSAEEGTQNNFNSSMSIDENQENSSEQLEVTPEEQIDLHNTVSEGEEENMDISSTSELNNSEFISAGYDLVPILLGMKANTTVEDLKSQIDTIIEEVKKSEGNGLTVKVYTSDEATEKISLILPNENTLDIEFTKVSENENSMKLTYLYEEEQVASSVDENGVITYSAEDEINESTDTKGTVKKDGIEININNISNEASNTMKISCSIIEKESINQKIEMELKTTGSATSNDITNNIVFGIKTDESEYKVLLDNNIKFSTNSEIENLTNENCVFLDELSPEERQTTLTAILEKINSVFEEKKEKLSFFDTNTNSTIIQRDLQTASTRVTKQEAKDALIEKFQSLYKEAQDNGQEFTLYNLENLEIEGFEVSSNITDEAAIIVVDTYTFKINSNFELSEE